MFKRPMQNLAELIAARRDGPDVMAQPPPQPIQLPPVQMEQPEGGSALSALAGMGTQRILAGLLAKQGGGENISSAAASAKAQGGGGWGGNVKTETFGLSPFPQRDGPTPMPRTFDEGTPLPTAKRKSFFDMMKRPEF